MTQKHWFQLNRLPFEEHLRLMKAFCQSHGSSTPTAEVRTPLIKYIRPRSIKLLPKNPGGAHLSIDTKSWLALLPMRGIGGCFSPN